MFSFFKKKQIDPKAKLKQHFGEFSLPSFPDVILKVLSEIRNPNTPTFELAKIISRDPGLSIKILKTVNSAAFRRRHQIENLGQAVTLLGSSSLESLVLSIGVNNSLPKVESDIFEMSRFWKTSAQKATLAALFSQILHPKNTMESFTAGLLQDMAIPLLVDKLGSKYEDTLKKWYDGHPDLTELEQNTFGWDHTEVASWICDSWQLPEGLALAISLHHKTPPESDECLPAVSLVSSLTETNQKQSLENIKQKAIDLHQMNPEMLGGLFEQAAKDAASFHQMMQS